MCVGITHGVFRNNKSGMESGEDEPKSWQEVSAASERMRGGGVGSDSDDGLEPKDQSVSSFFVAIFAPRFFLAFFLFCFSQDKL